jgi:hypothetical protein
MSSIVQVQQQRFFDCILEIKPDQTRYGYKRQTQKLANAGAMSAAPVAGRTLLDIEQQAAFNRQAGVIAKQQFVEFTQAHLHDQVAEELFLRLGNFDTVASTVFNLADGFPAVLDVLSARALTVSQLESHLTPVEWLKDDFLKLVNQPQYRNKTPSGNFIKEIKPAIGLLGLEAMKQVLPVFALKRALPHATDPFTGFKSQIWQYSIAVALAAQRLAEETGENPFVAYCAGLFHSLGYLVVARTYLRTYQQVKQAAMLKARDDRDTELTDALDSLDADASFLNSCFQEFAANISADLVSKWGLKRVPLSQILDQFAEGVGFSGASRLTEIVQQAVCFVQAQTLRKFKLLDDAEEQQWLLAVHLRPEHRQLLQKTRLDRLDFD